MTADFFFGCLFSCLLLPELLGQELKIIKTYTLPNELHEISGIITLDQGFSFYAINDGGNPAIIYHLDSIGQIIRRIKIPNASNIDWEDMTTDFKEYVYISDTGDNKRKRPEKKVYKIKINELQNKNEVFAETLNLNFLTIKSEKSSKNLNKTHDIEAVYWQNNELVFFSKNWNPKKMPISWIYRADQNQSKQTLYPFLSNKYSHRFYLESQISGACKDPNSDKIYLITGTELFECETSHLENKWTKYTFDFISQKEALCLLRENHLVITQEANKKLLQMPQMHFIQIIPPSK
ncbi:MAG: hypothetical protein IPH93_09035 [Saprospiraceae bacterium]|nr:hypothetical protein [Saprospiraceae bacterium]MBK7810637.1 hypothetical protein [Saprospiraceae bacterium]MBK9630229.1 hypothetical protein [Saprospiraceae bacterium]